MKRFTSFCSLLLVLLGSMSAQSGGGVPNAPSPYSRQAGPYLMSGLSGLALTVGASLGQRQLAPLTTAERLMLDPQGMPGLDRASLGGWRPGVARTSDIFLIGSILLPFPLLLGQRPRADIGPLILMGEETLLLTYGLTALTKWLVRRPRPFMYLAPGPDRPGLGAAQAERDARFAFFSGHTSIVSSMTFFTAQVFNDYYPQSKARPLVWGAAVALPAAVGWMRVRAGKHFPTDVIVGYLTGMAVGLLVPRLHRNK